MQGTGGDLYIGSARVGSVTTWRLTRAEMQGAPVTLTASGRIAAFWLSAGARRAMVRTTYRPRPARSNERRPVPTAPPPICFWGDIATLTATGFVLVNVTTRATNENDT